ncbi:MAG: hypothetical protein ABIC39_05350 [Pseudomonadota bacterium]
MKSKNSSPTDAIDRFWDKYIKYISDQGVKQSITRWYVIRAEHYIKAFQNKRLADHTPGDVNDYLMEQGKLGRIEDWQFRQMVDAIQNLFAMLNTSWFSEVDWKYWAASADSLPETHSTIARLTPAEETIDKLANLKNSGLTEGKYSGWFFMSFFQNAPEPFVERIHPNIFNGDANFPSRSEFSPAFGLAT